MIWIILLIIAIIWVLAGNYYVESGAYDRHGGWSLLIIAPFLIVGALMAIIGGILHPESRR